MRALTIYSHSNCWIYDRVFLIIATMLYITPPGLTYCITGSLYLLSFFTHFTHSFYLSLHLWQSVLCICEFIKKTFYFLSTREFNFCFSHLTFKVCFYSVYLCFPLILKFSAIFFQMLLLNLFPLSSLLELLLNIHLSLLIHPLYLLTFFLQFSFLNLSVLLSGLIFDTVL